MYKQLIYHYLNDCLSSGMVKVIVYTTASYAIFPVLLLIYFILYFKIYYSCTDYQRVRCNLLKHYISSGIPTLYPTMISLIISVLSHDLMTNQRGHGRRYIYIRSIYISTHEPGSPVGYDFPKRKGAQNGI